MKMRGQTQAMSVIIITGIIISLVSAAYIWGKPLIEKRSTVAEFSSIESFIIDLNDNIVEIANNGEGRATLEIPFGVLKLIPYDDADPDNNSLILEHYVSQPILFNSTIPIKTTNIEEVAEYGEALPRVILMEVSPFTEGHRLHMKLHYRELDSDTLPRKGYIIRLNPSSNNVARRRVTVSFGGNEIKEGEAANFGDLVVKYINLEMV
jgi:hypothetical protein